MPPVLRKRSNISERALTRDELEQLATAGLIPPDRQAEVFESYRHTINWQAWGARWSAALGVLFLLTGVVFFFAWNWKELSPIIRFSTLEGAVVLATLGALAAGIRKPAGQWLLLSASVFTGVLIAVYGQVYQTGADAFEVFALWSVLIFGWVLVSRFAPLWLLWFTVLQIALTTYGGQVLVPAQTIEWPTVYLVIGLLSTAFAALREWLATQVRFAWLRDEWLRIVLVSTALIWLSVIPWTMIFEFFWRDEGSPIRQVGLIIWTVVVVLGALFFTKIRPSLTCVGLCVLTGTTLLLAWLCRIIVEDNWDNSGYWLLVGILGILCFSGATKLIMLAARDISKSEAGAPE